MMEGRIKLTNPKFCPFIKKPCMGEGCAGFTAHSDGTVDYGDAVMLETRSGLKTKREVYGLFMGHKIYTQPRCMAITHGSSIQIADTVHSYEEEKTPQWLRYLNGAKDDMPVVKELPDPVKRAAEIRAKREANKQ